MNRRVFLSAVPLVITACSRPAAPISRTDQTEREKHLLLLESCRVSSNAVRTTPQPAADPLKRFPELKPLARISVRLHPRYGDEPGVRESKLGGTILYRDGDSWPLCPEYRIPMAAVLQIRADDLPTRFPMQARSDLFQLFWSPRVTKMGPPHVVGIWRSLADGQMPIANPELANTSDLGYVPVPCRLFPERLTEWPPVNLMPESMRRTLAGTTDLVTPARGVKVGGWPRVPDRAPKCTACVHPMDYLLTIDSCEWTANDRDRWKPKEDPDEEGYRRAAGLNFGSAGIGMQIYICQRCEHWPLRAVQI